MQIEWLEVSDEERQQARAIVAMVEQVLATMPQVHTVDPAVSRRQRAEGSSLIPVPEKLDHAVDRTIPGPAGEIPLRMIVPDDVGGVYLGASDRSSNPSATARRKASTAASRSPARAALHAML